MLPITEHAYAEEPKASDVKAAWDRADAALLQSRRAYWLNSSFTAGEQHITWDAAAGMTRMEDRYKSNVEADARMTVNKMRVRVKSHQARLTPNPLRFEVFPSGLTDAALTRHEVQEEILEAYRTSRDWERVRGEAIRQTILGGTGAVAVELDPDAGDEWAPHTETGREIRVGDVRLTALSIAEFSLEPGARSWREALWWVRRTAMTPEGAQERYDLPERPAADATHVTSAANRALARGRGLLGVDLVAVYVMYRRPSRSNGGYVAHVIGSQVVEFTPYWPYPFEHLNLYPFRETEIDGTWVGDTFVNDARQVQEAYNKVRTTTMTHANRAANARILAPQGWTMESDPFSDDVAEVVEYEGSMAAPAWMTAPDVPRWLSTLPAELEAELDDIFSTHAVSRGEAPGDRNSGLALSILAEKNDTPLGPFAKDQAAGWAIIGEMVLQCLRHLALSVQSPDGEPYSASIVVENEDRAPIEVRWTADMIDEHPRVVVPADSTAPRSHAAIQASLADMARAFPQAFQDLTSKQLARLLALPNPRAFTHADPNVRKARWENALLSQGVPQVPDELEDHAIHIALHLDDINSPESDTDDQDIAAAKRNHLQLHREYQAAERERLAQQMTAAQMGQLPGIPPPPELPPGSPDITSQGGPR